MLLYLYKNQVTKDTVQFAAISPPDCREQLQNPPLEKCYPPAEYLKLNCTYKSQKFHNVSQNPQSGFISKHSLHREYSYGHRYYDNSDKTLQLFLMKISSWMFAAILYTTCYLHNINLKS